LAPGEHPLQAMGGAKAIIATVTNAAAMQAISGGLGVNGTMMVRVRHAGATGDTGDYSSHDVEAMALRLAADAVRRGGLQ
jgi:hypothetical protein